MSNAKKKNPHAVSLGRLGGMAGTGAAKARTPEQAKAAVAVRWAKRKQATSVESLIGQKLGPYIKRRLKGVPVHTKKPLE